MRFLQRLASSRASKDLISLAIFAEAFFIPLIPWVAEAFLLAGMVLYLLRCFFDKSCNDRKSPFFYPITVFMVCGMASIGVSPDWNFSLYNWYNLALIYFFTFILVSRNLRRDVELRYLFKAMAVAAALSVGYGLFQHIFGIDTSQMKWVDGEAFPELRNRIFSTWENPNIFAAYLDIIICLLLGFFGYEKNGQKKLLLLALMGICTFCLAMTYARGALLTMVVIVAGYGAFKDRRLLLAVLLGGAALLLFDPVLLERMKTAFFVADTSSEMRIAMWESTLQMIMDHPILGVGWGAYWMVYPIYDTYIVDGSVTLVHAHNIYLNYMAEIGILGGLSFFVFFFGSMALALKGGRIYPNELQRKIMLGLGLALISVALNGITDDVLFNIPSSMLLWLLCGIIVAIDRGIY